MDERELKLRSFFTERGLTFKKASEMVGTHPSAIGNLVAGRNPFGAKVAKRWEDVFGISANWLMYGTGEMMANGTTPQTIINVTKNGNAINNNGSGNTANSENPETMSDAIGIIKKQQEQMDRMISLLEMSMGKNT